MYHKMTNSESLAEDRLSSLPDAVLTYILSFLTTKQSVCTSVLSTRWKHLFTSVPSLHFDCLELRNPANFANFVNKVLLLHNVSCIRSFHLLLPHLYDDGVSMSLVSWFSAAIYRHSQRLEIDIGRTIDFRIWSVPCGLYTCQMLVHLRLTGKFVFGVINTVCLPALKTIYFEYCQFGDGDLARRLFSSCPVLEDLTISECLTDINVFSISVPSLKSLTVCHLYSHCMWELNVPKLEYIHSESVMDKWYSVNILRSLHTAEIGYTSRSLDEYDDGISKLVNKFEEVQFLSLSEDSMGSLASASFFLPVLNKLTTLVLQVDYCGGWNLFPILLERSPCLELLVIQGRVFYFDEMLLQINVLSPENIPLCFSQSLKKVKLDHFGGEKVEFDWLGYLLKNAKVLEELTITVGLELRKEHYACDIREKLSALPRGSKTCQIHVFL